MWQDPAPVASAATPDAEQRLTLLLRAADALRGTSARNTHFCHSHGCENPTCELD